MNDAPNPYRLVTGWSDVPRHWAHPLALDVDTHDNLWVFDRREEAGCADSPAAPVFQLSPSGKMIRNFGANLFVFPHAVAADKDGNV